MITDSADGAVIDIRVIPRAGRTQVAGTRDGALLVRLAAAPVDGAANDALIEVLAAALRTSKRTLTIISGETSRRKRIRVAGVSAAAVRERLALP